MTMESTMSAPTLYSSLADDPDMGELVDWFVEELPRRIASLESAFAAADYDMLARTAHQLKGAAGSYGFDALTPALRDLEENVRRKVPESEVRGYLEHAVELCRRVRSGSPS